MSKHTARGKTAFEQLWWRCEHTDTKCPTCGYVDERGNWTSRTNGNRTHE